MPAKATNDPVVIPKGRGKPLSKISGATDKINKMNISDLRVLYRLLFQKRECRKQALIDIAQFNGWEDESMKHVFRAKLSKYTVTFMKRICKVVSLPSDATETKEVLLQSLSNFFDCPFQPTQQRANHRGVEGQSPLQKKSYAGRCHTPERQVHKPHLPNSPSASCLWTVPPVSINVIFAIMNAGSRKEGVSASSRLHAAGRGLI